MPPKVSFMSISERKKAIREYIASYVLDHDKIFTDGNSQRSAESNLKRTQGWNTLKQLIVSKFSTDMTIKQLQNQWKLTKRQASERIRDAQHGEEIKYRSATGGGIDTRQERRFSKESAPRSVEDRLMATLRGTPAFDGIGDKNGGSSILSRTNSNKRSRISSDENTDEDVLNVWDDNDDEDGGNMSDELFEDISPVKISNKRKRFSQVSDHYNEPLLEEHIDDLKRTSTHEDSLETELQLKNARPANNPTHAELMKMQYERELAQFDFYKNFSNVLETQNIIQRRMINLLELAESRLDTKTGSEANLDTKEDFVPADGDGNIEATAEILSYAT